MSPKPNPCTFYEHGGCHGSCVGRYCHARLVVWLDTWGPARAQCRLAAVERTRSRRARAGSRRTKRFHDVGRFRRDVRVSR